MSCCQVNCGPNWWWKLTYEFKSIDLSSLPCWNHFASVSPAPGKKWTGKAGKLCIDKLWRWMQANVAWMQQQKKDTKERQQKNKQKSNPFRWSHFRTIFGERREIVLTPRPYHLSPAHSAFDYRSDWIVCKWLGEEKWTVKRCTPRLLCTGVRRSENKTHIHTYVSTLRYYHHQALPKDRTSGIRMRNWCVFTRSLLFSFFFLVVIFLFCLRYSLFALVCIRCIGSPLESILWTACLFPNHHLRSRHPDPDKTGSFLTITYIVSRSKRYRNPVWWSTASQWKGYTLRDRKLSSGGILFIYLS